MRFGVIADDLTGALEMGALLASRGWCTDVVFGEDVDSEAEAVVIDTESRHLTPEEAAERVRVAASSLRADSVFKKVDSTLRGPVAAELRAFGGNVIFTPAYPAMGRTVVDGVLYVHGEPCTTPAPTMLDAYTDEDLAAIVANHPKARLAGSGGLGRAWVASLPQGNSAPPVLPKPRTVLLVCGSRHSASREQARRAKIPVLITPDEDDADPLAVVKQVSPHDLLILFGGDTAYAVLRRLGVGHVRAIQELMPGIALSTARGMMIVTKAGGFGPPDIVEQILGQLT